MSIEKIEILHGDGGKYTCELIEGLFYKNFKNKILLQNMDSSILDIKGNRIAFTTDSFVVNPIFFRGGDIGKLSVCGTINDLSVAGAKAQYLSVGFIIEEGFPFEKLENIVKSMANTADKVNVKIVTGDTKVVPKGKADGVFINTSGIGILQNYMPKKIQAKDSIIITGTIGEHGTAIEVDRYNLNVKGKIESDCAPLNFLFGLTKKYCDSIKIMKDPTRGGLGEILNEISKKSNLGIHIFEDKVPIRKEVQGINEMLGINPYYLACEGRAVLVVDSNKAKEIENELKIEYGCSNASIIGYVTDEQKVVYVENSFGGKRIIGSLESQMLPRIC